VEVNRQEPEIIRIPPRPHGTVRRERDAMDVAAGDLRGVPQVDDGDGRRSRRGRVVRELCVSVQTPGARAAVAEDPEPEGVAGAGADHRTLQNACGSGAHASARAITELPVLITPPRPKGTTRRAVGFYPEAVSLAGCDRTDPAHGADGCWGQARRLGPITELSAIVCAPRPQRAVPRNGQAVRAADGNRDDVRECPGSYGRRSIGLRSVSELPAAVEPPAPDRPIAFQCEMVSAHTGGDGDDIGESAHLHRRGPLRRGAVAKLAVRIRSPGPDSAVRF